MHREISWHTRVDTVEQNKLYGTGSPYTVHNMREASVNGQLVFTLVWAALAISCVVFVCVVLYMFFYMYIPLRTYVYICASVHLPSLECMGIYVGGGALCMWLGHTYIYACNMSYTFNQKWQKASLSANVSSTKHSCMYVCGLAVGTYIIAVVSLAISYNKKNMQHINFNWQLKICMHKGMISHESM